MVNDDKSVKNPGSDCYEVCSLLSSSIRCDPGCVFRGLGGDERKASRLGTLMTLSMDGMRRKMRSSVGKC